MIRNRILSLLVCAALLACLLATCAPLRSVGRMDPVTAIAGAE